MSSIIKIFQDISKLRCLVYDEYIMMIFSFSHNTFTYFLDLCTWFMMRKTVPKTLISIDSLQTHTPWWMHLWIQIMVHFVLVVADLLASYQLVNVRREVGLLIIIFDDIKTCFCESTFPWINLRSKTPNAPMSIRIHWKIVLIFYSTWTSIIL